MTCKYTHLYDNESKTFVCNELCYSGRLLYIPSGGKQNLEKTVQV